ncbi:glycosyltransferase [Candidatus Saccharibacteria bacterium]|nr:glycosyltransferase [Candidatus Saccharibacteria bacterium]
MSDKKIEELIEENAKLKSELSSLKKIVNSKRFKTANKAANYFNQLFPVTSRRRKVVNSILNVSKKKNKAGLKKEEKKILKFINNKSEIIIICGTPFSTPLKQRSHHLAECLADLGVAVVYYELGEYRKNTRIKNSNLAITNKWELIKTIIKTNNRVFFSFNNVADVSLSRIEWVKNNGAYIIYEVVDELHEDITEATFKQKQVWKKMPEYEPAIVIATSQKLLKEAKEHFKKAGSMVVLSKNAVDTGVFNNKNVKYPKELKVVKKNKKAIVGYYGALAPWIDFDLIKKLAESDNNIGVVLIGADYSNTLKNVDLNGENIYYLGPKKYEELRNYSYYFDTAIIPFKKGEIAKGTSPIKLFEYMAMGKTVVVTSDLEECVGYDGVLVAKNDEEFIEMVNEAVELGKESGMRKKIIDQVKNNTWQIRAEEIKKLLEGIK